MKWPTKLLLFITIIVIQQPNYAAAAAALFANTRGRHCALDTDRLHLFIGESLVVCALSVSCCSLPVWSLSIHRIRSAVWGA